MMFSNDYDDLTDPMANELAKVVTRPCNHIHTHKQAVAILFLISLNASLSEEILGVYRSRIS